MTQRLVEPILTTVNSNVHSFCMYIYRLNVKVHKIPSRLEDYGLFICVAIRIFGVYTHAQLHRRKKFWNDVAKDLGRQGETYRNRYAHSNRLGWTISVELIPMSLDVGVAAKAATLGRTCSRPLRSLHVLSKRLPRTTLSCCPQLSQTQT